MGASRRTAGEKFNSGLVRNREENNRTSHELLDHTLAELAKETNDMISSLRKIPASLVELCNKFFEPDKPDYKSVLEDLDTNAKDAQKSTQRAFEGAGEDKGKLITDKPKRETLVTDAKGGTPIDPPKSCAGCDDSKTKDPATTPDPKLPDAATKNPEILRPRLPQPRER